MKQRITYIVNEATDAAKGGLDPSNLEVGKQHLKVKGLDAAKELRITLGLEDVPEEIRELLASSHEIYFRWSSPRAYKAVAPFASRVSAGLHAFFSPIRGRENDRAVCLLLRQLFGLADITCSSIEAPFTTPPILSGRFSHSAARQFHTTLSTLDDVADSLIVKDYCPSRSTACEIAIRDLARADYVDLDYDSISHVFNIRAFWSRSHNANNLWVETHDLQSKGDSLEVGVLVNEKPFDAEELKYSGVLVQVGKDDEPSPVLFSFPARHHLDPSRAVFTTSFGQPTGLHPTLRVTLPSIPSRNGLPSRSCALHTYLTLSKALFIDKYPLSDPLLLKQHNLKALRALSGATDLEAPEYVTKEWGSAALFEIATSSNLQSDGKPTDSFSFTIPLHLRYQPPSLNSTHTFVDVPAPAVFWACPATDSGANTGSLEASPFDRVNLGYDGLFGPRTLFYHLMPVGNISSADIGGEIVTTIAVPVLDAGKGWYVEWGTVLAVLLGTFVVCVPLLRVLRKDFGDRLGDMRNHKGESSKVGGGASRSRKEKRR